MTEMYKIRGTRVEVPYPVQLTPGETRLVFSLERHFVPERILVDVYLPRTEFGDVGDFKSISPLETRLTQIDCIAVNEMGVFVIESKDFSGWIYGDFGQKKWTQVLDYGRDKHSFYNPFLQNQAHVDAVRDLIGEGVPIFSVVVFGNKAVLKTLKGVSVNHYYCLQAGIHELMAKIRGKLRASLSEAKMVEICNLIGQGRVIPDAGTIATHIDEVGRAKRNALRSYHKTYKS